MRRILQRIVFFTALLPIFAHAAAPEEKAPGELRVQIKEFRFISAETNRPLVFSTNILSGLLTNYVGRVLGDVELEAARRTITEFYISHGYLNSGAILPDQDLADGVVTMVIVEGRLTEVYVHGLKHLKQGFVKRRVKAGAAQPLNLNQLADTLNELRRNPNIEKIVADIQPVKNGDEVVQGASALDLGIEEARPCHVGLQAGNYRPASIGAETLELLAIDQNLTGNSDSLQLQYGILQRSKHDGAEFSGVDNLGVSYAIPVTARDTTLGIFYDRHDYTVIEEPFDAIDVESRYQAYGIRVDQPILRENGHQFGMGLAFEKRLSKSFLFGQPFSFSPGSVDGKSEVSVLRLSVTWDKAWIEHILALRLTGSWGMNVWGATRLPTDPDGQFFSILGQWQYTWLINSNLVAPAFAGTQLVFRGGFQWANDPLLSMEQFSLGGANTIRGYRENQIVRDTGVFASAELRVPIVRNKRGEDILQIAPFFDIGGGWNIDSPSRGPDSLSSAGLSLICQLRRRLDARLDWGYAFRNTHNPENDLQDFGIHFRITYFLF